MKRAGNVRFSILFALVCCEAFGASPLRAQGTLQVSNIGQAPTSKAIVASDDWIAQGFGILVTDPNKYTLDSIQLQMYPGTGSPGGFSLSVYASTGNAQEGFGNVPGTLLGALTGPNPAAGGVFTFTPTGNITLSGGEYFVVATAATPAAQGGYVWSSTDVGAQNGTWLINDVYASSANGSNWTPTIRQNIFQMAIYTTPTPEPATFGIMAAGLAVFGICRRHFSRK
jgi:PEP-CTERM motif